MAANGLGKCLLGLILTLGTVNVVFYLIVQEYTTYPTSVIGTCEDVTHADFQCQCVKLEQPQSVHSNTSYRTNTAILNEFKKSHSSKNDYIISFYFLPMQLSTRKRRTLKNVFDNCKFKNCIVTYNAKVHTRSDAVIFKGRRLPQSYPFDRPLGQVWIFYEEEIPLSYDKFGGNWKSETWKGAFNYTITYDRNNTDIYIPYGLISKRAVVPARDYIAIARSKSKDAVIITSHCKTRSKRMEYIEQLRKYIDVDIFGGCGQPFNCGHQYKHNSCFDILNTTYRFYLAFENAFCRNYMTEKFYANFNYDILLVVRGDQSYFKHTQVDAKDAYISTDDFPSAESLGNYLRHLSKSPAEYAKILRHKDQFTSTFEVGYKRAMCNICERLNNQQKFHKEINNLVDWALGESVCYNPTDL